MAETEALNELLEGCHVETGRFGHETSSGNLRG
jgi:hypothetical protein